MKYVPLFDGILESTLWDEALEVRTLYFTLLLLMDADYVVRLDFEKVARKARLRQDRRENYQEAQKAMAVLLAPDALTMAQQKDDGIRVKQVEGGYFVVSGAKYQELMYSINSARRRRKAQKERREQERIIRKARPIVGENADVKHGVEIHEHRTQKPEETVAEQSGGVGASGRRPVEGVVGGEVRGMVRDESQRGTGGAVQRAGGHLGDNGSGVGEGNPEIESESSGEPVTEEPEESEPGVYL